MSTPRATYRLQCHKDFGFDSIAAIAGYLARLGISDVYASPWLKARPGSTHGYDIVDHHKLNPELGDDAAFDRMMHALDEHHLGRILDFVPNHMGVGGSDNPLWLDVLEWGRDASHAGWFDIDWQPDRFSLRDKLLVPLLARQYGIELYDGKLQLKFDPDEGSFAVWAYETHKLPICPLHYERILTDALPELERLGDLFASLEEWRPQITARAHELKSEMAHAARSRSGVRDAINEAVSHFNGTPGKPASWTSLHELIQDQHWRVAHFRVAGDDINYRRFFDINELAGLRMELSDVFEHAHSLVLELLCEGKLNGIRIDHVDGLLNPKRYLEKLREKIGESCYLIVEKILAYHEGLREDWPVQGTTGYEFGNLVLGLLIDPAGEPPLTSYYREFTREMCNFSDVVRACKMRIMRDEMASELNVLAREAARVAYQRPETADFTQNVLRRAIREIVACFPVYRTYVDNAGKPTADDRRDLNWAMKQARANDTYIDPSVFDFLGAMLSGDLVAQPHSGFSRHAVLRCAMKLQQYSGPVMAKGLEDTAFYRYNRFVALNEVGGFPDHFGTSIQNFHKANLQRAKFWPHCMLATSTHDTKRGEDVRARLAVISEMPEQWMKQTRLWSRMLRARRGDIEAEAPPDGNDEYLFYQLLVGSWPAELSPADEQGLKDYATRLKEAMRKSIREAKIHSTWAAPNLAYEEPVMTFIDGALDPNDSQAFLTEFLPFQERIARLGMENSLVQTILKLTVPGVPDIYQGAELWNLSLVDPDNRRPVDYCARMRLLNEVRSGEVCIRKVKTLMKNWQSGAIKLFLIAHVLECRQSDPDLFDNGDYEPLLAAGPKADCIVGFVRIRDNRAVLVVTARFPFRRHGDPGWQGTTIALPSQIASGRFRNIFTGKRFSALDVERGLDLIFEGVPVAVLTLESR